MSSMGDANASSVNKEKVNIYTLFSLTAVSDLCRTFFFSVFKHQDELPNEDELGDMLGKLTVEVCVFWWSTCVFFLHAFVSFFWKVKPCKCGSLQHKRTNHSSCPLNKRKPQPTEFPPSSEEEVRVCGYGLLELIFLQVRSNSFVFFSCILQSDDSGYGSDGYMCVDCGHVGSMHDSCAQHEDCDWDIYADYGCDRCIDCFEAWLATDEGKEYLEETDPNAEPKVCLYFSV